MPRQFGGAFTKKQVRLTSSGVFKFDAVAADGQIIASISTSAPKTVSGKAASGKIHKIRADTFFLLFTETSRRMIILTDREMHERWMKERDGGRVPDSIEFFYARLPAALARWIEASRKTASDEVSPH